MENFIVPAFVGEVIDKIEQNGYEAWLVGGCVRDTLMGETPKDYDVASSAPCEEICRLFDKVIETGIKHGTVTVISDSRPVEVTRYRIDGEYADHRRPDKVEFTPDFKADLSRRDFTVNAIGYSPKRGIIDPFGGEADIKAKILRTVGDPEKRFDEDALRIMRAVRFASTLEFKIEENTLASAKKLSPTLKNVSVERIFSELKKTLSGNRPELIEHIINNGGLSHVGLCRCDRLASIKKADGLTARLAVMITLCGGNAFEVLSALKSDNETKKAVIKIADMLNPELPLDRVSLKKHMSRIGEKGLCDLLEVEKALFGVEIGSAKAEIADIILKNEPYRIADLEISGDEITETGISGKKVGETLEHLLQKAIENPEINEKNRLKSLIAKN